MTMAVLTEKPHCSRVWRASSSSTPAAVDTMEMARRTSFSLVGITSTIRLPYTLPRRIMAPVEIMLSTIFSAVPLFMRVEPVMTSGPVSTPMGISAAAFISEFLLQVRATVLAPISWA